MSKTFAEKALARSAGQSSIVAGQIVDASPDVILSHDNTAAIWKIFRALGVDKVKYPDRLAITLDHAVPAPSTQHAQNHADVRRFVDEMGVTNFFEVGRGICHQVLSEEAIVLPGQTVLGSDSHTPHFGWLGAFGAGLGRSEVAALWATGEIWLRVPESLKITVTGELPPWVTSKDLCLKIIGDLGAEGGLYYSLEFHGDAIPKMSLDSRMVIPNMMAEFGVKNAYLFPDDVVFEYLAPRLKKRLEATYQKTGGRRINIGLPDLPTILSNLTNLALYPDADAAYAAEHTFDASALEPMVACPHSVDNVKPLSEIRGTRVQQAFIGTCTNGRLEDIAAAAEIVRGKQVAKGTRLLVIPASSQVLREALQQGYVQDLTDAGAVIGVPGCGPCMGNHMGVPAPNEVTISSANRNFRGRMGTRDSEIYLASPAVVAASAIVGSIADPRSVLS